MAQYNWYRFDMPGNYQDYMPDYTTYDYTRPSDQYSDNTSVYAGDIANAQNRLSSLERNKPGAYRSNYGNQISDLIKTLSNRKFTYDVNGDAMYQQYKNSYMNQGKQAMEDSIGQASAMTGGYGNSYAAAVGNQAYQGYLDKLNDKIPELRQMALNEYNTESSDLQNLYTILNSQESSDYSRYRDTVSDYQNDRNFYNTQLQNLRSMAQSLWGDEWKNYWNAAERNDSNYNNAINAALTAWQQAWKNYQWGEEQTQHNYEYAVSEDQWNSEFLENQRQFDEQMQYNYDDLDEDRRWHDAQTQYNYDDLEEDRRWHDAQTQYNYDDLAEDRRQYDNTLQYNCSSRNSSNSTTSSSSSNSSSGNSSSGNSSSTSSNNSNSSLSSSLSSSSNGTTSNSSNKYNDSAKLKQFRASILTPDEFSRRISNRNNVTVDGKKYTNYNQYVIAQAKKWYGSLSDSELEAIISAHL